MHFPLYKGPEEAEGPDGSEEPTGPEEPEEPAGPEGPESLDQPVLYELPDGVSGKIAFTNCIFSENGYQYFSIYKMLS